PRLPAHRLRLLLEAPPLPRDTGRLGPPLDAPLEHRAELSGDPAAQLDRGVPQLLLFLATRAPRLRPADALVPDRDQRRVADRLASRDLRSRPALGARLQPPGLSPRASLARPRARALQLHLDAHPLGQALRHVPPARANGGLRDRRSAG